MLVNSVHNVFNTIENILKKFIPLYYFTQHMYDMNVYIFECIEM